MSDPRQDLMEDDSDTLIALRIPALTGLRDTDSMGGPFGRWRRIQNAPRSPYLAVLPRRHASSTFLALVL